MAATVDKEVLVDEGYATFQVGDIETRVDIFQAYNKIVEITSANPNPSAYHDAIRKYMVEIGLPSGSDQLAVAFAERISGRVAALKKNVGDAVLPKSPDSIT